MTSPTPVDQTAVPGPRRWPLLLVLLLATLIGLTTIGVDYAIRRNVERIESSVALLLRFEGQAYRLSALEWQSIAEGTVSPETRLKVQSTRVAMTGMLDELVAQDHGAGLARSISEAYGAYSRALGEEFKLIEMGDIDGARRIDATAVDPGFVVLSEAISSASTAYSEDAARLELTAVGGFALVMIAGIVATVLVFWRFQKEQGAVEAAVAEQRVIARREEDLRILGEMVEGLRDCNTLAAAYERIVAAAQRLFPIGSGALLVPNGTNDAFEAVTVWGDPPASLLESAPALKDCPSFRQGQSYSVADTDKGSLCEHMNRSDVASCLCVPMTVGHETLGVLYFSYDAASMGAEPLDRAIKSRRQLAVAIAENAALSLANIELHAALLDQAIHDSLSNLYNRRYLQEALGRELRRAERSDVPVSAVMLDIDNLKRINDTFGHAAGDAAIVALSALLGDFIRGEDIACRYGGDEFVLVLPGASMEDASRRAEQLRSAVERLSVDYRGQELPRLTVSLGVSVARRHGQTADGLVDAADAALYVAKAQGRNRLVVAHDEPDPLGETEDQLDHRPSGEGPDG